MQGCGYRRAERAEPPPVSGAREAPPRTHRDVLVVLAQLVGPCHHLPLGNPLLQVIHLAVELEQPVPLVQLAPPLLGQVLQARVELVHLGLAHADALAGKANSAESALPLQAKPSGENCKE